MTWRDQGRQYHMWFGHGTAPDKGKPVAGSSVSGKSIEDRVSALAYGAVAALPASLRGRAEGQYEHGTLPRLKEAMTAWINGTRLDRATFGDQVQPGHQCRRCKREDDSGHHGLDTGRRWGRKTYNSTAREITMLSEYDVVRLRSATSAAGIPVGTRGTILIVYFDTPPAYEVEFVDDVGGSLGTFTVREGDLDLEWAA